MVILFVGFFSSNLRSKSLKNHALLLLPFSRYISPIQHNWVSILNNFYEVKKICHSLLTSLTSWGHHCKMVILSKTEHIVYTPLPIPIFLSQRLTSNRKPLKSSEPPISGGRNCSVPSVSFTEPDKFLSKNSLFPSNI